MDAVELPYPVDVAAPKLMGTEGFVRAGVTDREVEARESDGVSVLVSPPIERCKTLLSQKDVRTVVMASESGACNKIPDAELCKHADQLPSFRREDVSAHCCDVETNCLLKCPQPEGVQLQRRAVKVSRSGSVCSKKPRLAQMEDSLSIAGGDDKKYMTDKLELNPTRCTSPAIALALKPAPCPGPEACPMPWPPLRDSNGVTAYNNVCMPGGMKQFGQSKDFKHPWTQLQTNSIVR